MFAIYALSLHLERKVFFLDEILWDSEVQEEGGSGSSPLLARSRSLSSAFNKSFVLSVRIKC